MLRKMAVVSPLAAALAAIIALTVAISASANSIPTTGDQIRFFPTPTSSYPADTAFYVESGFACTFPEVEICTNAETSFVLFVDGVRQSSQKMSTTRS
jgi:hypothetical protein